MNRLLMITGMVLISVAVLLTLGSVWWWAMLGIDVRVAFVITIVTVLLGPGAAIMFSDDARQVARALIRREEAEMTRTLYKYEPDFAVAPGETLKELLEDLGMTQAELATRTGLSPKHVNQVIQGHVGLTPDMAARIEPVVGVPARVWNSLESNYRDQLIRLDAADQLGD